MVHVPHPVSDTFIQIMDKIQNENPTDETIKSCSMLISEETLQYYD
jgi:hypothetical protein